MRDNLKVAGVFLLKAVTFSVIFWVMWVYTIRPITSAQSTNVSSNSKAGAGSTDNEVAMKKYMEQATKVEEQQKRMDAILTKQEQQGRRLDDVLSAWEKQTKGAK